jgi:hypothetical protein
MREPRLLNGELVLSTRTRSVASGQVEKKKIDKATA